MLKGIEDVTRIVQRFLFNKGGVEDLAAIKDTIEMWVLIKERILIEGQQHTVEGSEKDPDWNSLVALVSRMQHLQDVARRIGMAVDSNELKKKEQTSTSPEDQMLMLDDTEAEPDDDDIDIPVGPDQPIQDRRLGSFRPAAWTINPQLVHPPSLAQSFF